MDEAYAREVDLHLARAKQRFCCLLMDWRQSQGLSMKRLSDISLEISGRRRINNNILTRMDKATADLDAAESLMPSESIFVGIGQMNSVLQTLADGNALPTGIRLELVRGIRPFRDEDGNLMTYPYSILYFSGCHKGDGLPQRPLVRLLHFLEPRALGTAVEGFLKRENRCLLDLLADLHDHEGADGPILQFLRGWGEVSLDRLRTILPELLVILSRIAGREVTVHELVLPPNSAAA